MGTMMRDDLGEPVDLTSRPCMRVVSLVPSLTEAVAATRPEALVGATTFCTHPPTLAVARVRGTKNVDCKTVVGLAPDLVIANKEENRRIDVERLRGAGLPVWVTVIEDVDQALVSMHRLFTEALGWGTPAWLQEATLRWSAPPCAPRVRVAVPIWRDPWMVIGSRTYTGDLLARAGLVNVFEEHAERYPKVHLDEIDRDDVDLVLLPDEPYEFTASDGPASFQRAPTQLVSGRLLTWYGPAMLEAADWLLPS